MTPQEALARIRTCDPKLRAFVQVFDPPLSAERDEGPVLAVKDMIDVAGVPTGGGARTPLDISPRRHAVVVERLLQGGWSIVGKTQTVELAYGGWGTNRAVGAPWNPWDLAVHRAPGGSSSGSAVAVAAGLCDIALGTDTGGSVRIPAAVCGVVGLKPGRGLVSLQGVHPLSPSLDTVGVLARDVATAAHALGVMSGPDGHEAVRGPLPDIARPRDLTDVRLAAVPVTELGPLGREVERAYLDAIEALRGAGATVIFADPPAAFHGSFEPNGFLMASEGWRAWRARIERHRDEMDPWIVRRFEAGREITDTQLAEAHLRRDADQRAFTAWLQPYDGLILPTCPIVAPPMDDVDETTSPLSRLTRAANYLDLPGASVPCALSPGGLPIGLQILGKPRDEVGMIRIALGFEAVSGWNGRRPDLVTLGVTAAAG